MIVELFADDSIRQDLSNELETLAQSQFAAGIEVERSHSKGKLGEKAIDLEMLTFILGSISTFVSILSLWLQSRPIYSIDVEIDGKTLTVENPSEEDLEAILTGKVYKAKSSKVKMILRSKQKK